MDFPHVVIARMFEHIGPIDRGERYEDPLDEVLAAASIGRVTGGGSQLNERGGIEFADVEIELADLDQALQVVSETLEKSGAPQGSELIDGEDGRVLREFGTQECLGIYLDGRSLPAEVYANLDFDDVVHAIGAAGGPDSYRGGWQGAEETAIYLFGPNAEEIFTRVEPVLRRLPIGQNARVVIRDGKASLNPREVRIPRAE